MQRSKTPKSYRRKQIPKYGPNILFYVGLSSIAINYIISFKKDATLWNIIPKNTTDVKMKIIELLITLRKMSLNSKYVLDQLQFLHLLKTNGEVSNLQLLWRTTINQDLFVSYRVARCIVSILYIQK